MVMRVIPLEEALLRHVRESQSACRSEREPQLGQEGEVSYRVDFAANKHDHYIRYIGRRCGTQTKVSFLPSLLVD